MIGLTEQALHSWRSTAVFPENLLESELFGYEKDLHRCKGPEARAFEMAQNGTIFLDEIGEMPMKLRPSCCGALEYRRFKDLVERKILYLMPA